MNKKFFTLIASALMLVAGTVGNAQTAIPPGKIAPLEDGKKYQIALTTIQFVEANNTNSGISSYKDWLLAPPSATSKATSLTDAENIYKDLQSATAFTFTTGLGKSVTTTPLWYAWIDKDGNLRGDRHDDFVTSSQNDGKAQFYESIFCLTLGEVTNTGTAPLNVYSFANGFQLLVNPKLATTYSSNNTSGSAGFTTPPSTYYPGPTLNAGTGSEGDWGYSSTYGRENQHWMPLYVYEGSRRDSAYIFVADADASNSLRLVKTDMQDIRTGNLHPSTILFEFVQPAPRVLSAADYNTKMGLEQLNGTKGRILAFDPKPNYSPADPNADLSTYWSDKVKTAPWQYLKLYAETARPFTSPDASHPDDAMTTIASYNDGPWLYFRVSDDNEQYKGFDDWGAGVKAGTGKYLYVDTAYYGDLNTENLTFAFSRLSDGIRANTKKVTADISTLSGFAYKGGKISDALYSDVFLNNAAAYTSAPYISDFVNQYRFQATYFWYNDSLAIDVLQANMKPRIWTGANANGTAIDAGKSWFQYEPLLWTPPYYEWAAIKGRLVGQSGTGGFNNAANAQAAPNWGDNFLANVNFLSDRFTGNKATEGDYLHIKLADLPNNAKYLTVGGRTIGTKIGLGIGDCSGSAETSIDEGVYVIRNIGLDRYLTVPIYSTDTRWLNQNSYGSYYEGTEDNQFTNVANNWAAWLTLRHDGKAGVDTYQDVNPYRMPSYHWIVQKVDKKHPANSPINIINREFPDIMFRNVKLIKDEKGLSLSGFGIYIENTGNINSLTDATNANASKASFQKVPKDLLEDKYLGYYHKPEVTGSQEQKYDLNYYNWAFEDQPQVYFLNKGISEKDSALRVNRARTLQFRFDQFGDATNKYGYEPTGKGVELEGVQLERSAYYLVADLYEDGKKVERQIFPNAERRYALNRPYYYGTPFLLKTQNYAKTLDAKNDELSDFYALVQVIGDNHYYYVDQNARNNDKKTWVTSYRTEAGRLNIMNDALWAYQNASNSIVTSTFAVTQYTPPLYRRFDGAEYPYNSLTDATATTKEDFAGGKGDVQGPLYLKFFNATQPGQFLFENTNEVSDKKPNGNPYRSGLKNTAISFLGTQNIYQFPEQLKANKENEYVVNYTFYVDTAFSKRTSGGKFTSNHDELTSKPQYMLALNPTVLPERTIWWESGFHVWIDANGKPISGEGWEKPDYSGPEELKVRAMTVGKYLFNAEDSIAAGNLDYQGKIVDKIGNTTRLSFIKGAHVGDTFYVLTGTQYETWSGEQIQVYEKLYNILSGLPVYYKHYLGRNDHYRPRYAARGYSVATVQKMIDKAKSKSTKTGDEFNTYFNTNNDDGKVNKFNGNSMVFQFRLANVFNYENDKRIFYIESRTATSEQYGPASAYFVQEINTGAPIINNSSTSFTNPGNDMAPMGIQVTQEGIELDDKGNAPATANEAAQLSDAARVISGVNQISILNAAGKTVTVTNVLGQTVAKTVATSDNATITLPKGIVVVSVDGKSTKAVVK
jgi:hypothetical protein